jgi:hypothetical protein
MNKTTIVRYEKTGRLRLLSNNKVYDYEGVSQYYYDKIETLLKKGRIGSAFKILKQFRKERENGSNGKLQNV